MATGRLADQEADYSLQRKEGLLRRNIPPGPFTPFEHTLCIELLYVINYKLQKIL